MASRELTKNEQVSKNGSIVLDYDQKLTKKEIEDLMFETFCGVIKVDGKQFVLYDKIGILACNITYLNKPHPTYKKRMQLKPYYLEYLEENRKSGLETLYVGIYTYNQTRLFVVFETDTFRGKKSNNSSAHVYSFNLQYAKRVGKFDKIDAFGNKVHVFNTYEFVRYIKTMAGDSLGGEDGFYLEKTIKDHFSRFAKKVPPVWNGIKCYKELIDSKNRNARQNRWEGFYFEYLFKKYLEENNVKEISWHADKTKNGIDLDLVFDDEKWIYGDLKADNEADSIQGNDLETIGRVVKDNKGLVYYCCCRFTFEKDSNHNYRVTKYWNELRDEKEKYKTFSEIKNGFGKYMKYSVKPKYLCVLKIDEAAFDILKQKPRKQGHNSDGKPRKDKIQIFKDKIDSLSVLTINF